MPIVPCGAEIIILGQGFYFVDYGMVVDVIYLLLYEPVCFNYFSMIAVLPYFIILIGF